MTTHRVPRTGPRFKTQNGQSNTPIYAAGRIVGYVAGATFFKRVFGSKHFLRRPRAIALDVQSIYDAQDAGATMAEITDGETGRVYRVALDVMLRDGFHFNRGWGAQVALPVDDFDRPDLGEQLDLFAALEVQR